MFVPTLESQTTPEQKEKWFPKAESYEIIGTFAQTELGHGNYLIMAARQLAGRRPLYFTADISILLLFFSSPNL